MKKKWITTILSVLFITLTSVAGTDYKEKEVEMKDLPTIAQEFITNHFAQYAVNNIRVVKYGYYKVNLNDGYEILFDRKGKWNEIENKMHTALPASVVALLPANTTNYLSEKYPQWTIYGIERNKHGYEVELHGDKKIELHFDPNGNFRREKTD